MAQQGCYTGQRMKEPGQPRTDPDRWWLLPTGLLVVGLLLNIPFWITDLDLRVARAIAAWNEAAGRQQQDRWWWLVPYYVPTALVVGLILGGLYGIARGWRQPSSALLRPGLYVLLVLGLGCGLLVNVVLKDQWGRPRPRQVVEFGGTMAYLPPWQLGVPGSGKSFPSGHVAVPAACTCLWLLWRRRRPTLARWCLVGSLALAAWVGVARMLAQGHWLSDVLWATVLMFAVAAVLHRLLLYKLPSEPSA